MNLLALYSAAVAAAPAVAPPGIDERISRAMEPFAALVAKVVLYPIPIGGLEVPWILFWLIAASIFCTFYFRFINVRGFMQGFRIIRGDYSDPRGPGEVSHFQALATALSGTVGLGNISGVALAVAIGGPGATFWMIFAGIIGMSAKFCECTLGVMYRNDNPDGSVSGGPMYYLSKGIAEHYPALAPLEQPQFKDYGAAQADKMRITARWLDQVLARQPYVAGERFTIADITAFCALEFGRGLLRFSAPITGQVVPSEGARYRAKPLMLRLVGAHEAGRYGLAYSLAQLPALLSDEAPFTRAQLCDAMDENFNLRHKMLGPENVGVYNLEMVTLARQHGFAAKQAGSGGAVFCVPRADLSDKEVAAIRVSLRERGYVLCRVAPVVSSKHE